MSLHQKGQFGPRILHPLQPPFTKVGILLGFSDPKEAKELDPKLAKNRSKISQESAPKLVQTLHQKWQFRPRILYNPNFLELAYFGCFRTQKWQENWIKNRPKISLEIGLEIGLDIGLEIGLAIGSKIGPISSKKLAQILHQKGQFGSRILHCLQPPFTKVGILWGFSDPKEAKELDPKLDLN